MANTNVNRKPPGTPAGGQFAPSSHPESEVTINSGTTLTEVRPGRWEARLPDGKLHDPDDGSPAERLLRSNGSVESEWHYQNGELQDPGDGSPAVRSFYPNGSVGREEHCRSGALQDPDDGSPAVRDFRPDGSVESEYHYQNGELQEL